MASQSGYGRKPRKHGFLKFMIFIACAVCMVAAAKLILAEKQDSGEGLHLPFMDTASSVSSSASDGGTEDEEVLQALYRIADEDSRVSDVLSQLQLYPEPLLALLAKNPEARDFVLDYPSHMNETDFGKITHAELAADIPHFLQWDERWGYVNYGSSVLGVTGCGPTCLSMVAVGLTGDSTATPAAVSDFSERSGYYVDGSGSSWELMKDGAASYGLNVVEVPLSEDSMISELSSGHPIILSVGAGDFTDNGHFIVVKDYVDGMFIINDPNSLSKSSEGWYYSTLAPQIQNIWAFNAA